MSDLGEITAILVRDDRHFTKIYGVSGTFDPFQKEIWNAAAMTKPREEGFCWCTKRLIFPPIEQDRLCAMLQIFPPKDEAMREAYKYVEGHVIEKSRIVDLTYGKILPTNPVLFCAFYSDGLNEHYRCK